MPNQFICLNCGHHWYPRWSKTQRDGKPQKCPSCRNFLTPNNHEVSTWWEQDGLPKGIGIIISILLCILGIFGIVTIFFN